MRKKSKLIERPCLTPEAVYSTKVESHRITVTVQCPASIDLLMPHEGRRDGLEGRVHDAMEWVLGPWFYHAVIARRVELVQKTGWPDFYLSPEETAELAKLDAYVDGLAAFSETPSDNESMMIIREAAKSLRNAGTNKGCVRTDCPRIDTHTSEG